MIAYYKSGVIDSDYAWWTPDPLLQPSNGDGDVTLYLISAQGIWYTSEIDDDVYSSHSSMYYEGIQYFTADEPASIIGCKAQQQFCIPPSPQQPRRCGPLTSRADFRASINETLASDEKFLALVNTFRVALGSSSVNMAGVVDLMGSYALQAKSSLYERLSGFLPSNQWQLDVENWFSISQASTQLSSVRVATGPSNRNWSRALILPSTEEEHYICTNQVRSIVCNEVQSLTENRR